MDVAGDAAPGDHDRLTGLFQNTVKLKVAFFDQAYTFAGRAPNF